MLLNLSTNRLFHWYAQAALVLAIALPWLNPFAPGPSPAVVQTLVTLLCLALLLLTLRPQMSAPERAQTVAMSWMVAASLSCVAGLCQYIGISEHLSPWVNMTAAGDAFGNLRQRNQFATLTNTGLVALIYLAARRPWNDRTGAEKGGYFALAVLLSVGNAVSSSRTGVGQLVLLVGLAAVWRCTRHSGRLQILTVAVLSYCLGLFLMPWVAGLDPLNSGLLGRLHGNVASCNSRLTLWGNVLHLIAQRPWLGWGWGELDYAHFITLYPGARFCDILDNAHNLPLHLAVELGVPAALLVCIAGLCLVWRARPWVEQDAGRQMAWGVLAIILLHSMLEYPLWYGPFQMAFGLCVMLLWRPLRGPIKPSPRPAYMPSNPAIAIAVVLMLAVGYAAWDYYRISQIYTPPEERAERYRDDTLEKIKASWLFHEQVAFAELTTVAVTRENAARMQAMASDLLHFSPEARVVEKLIESATLLGRVDVATFHLQRLKAAFPTEYALWRKGLQLPQAEPITR